MSSGPVPLSLWSHSGASVCISVKQCNPKGGPSNENPTWIASLTSWFQLMGGISQSSWETEQPLSPSWPLFDNLIVISGNEEL